MSPDPWTWIAAFLTLMIFSFLYKDNPFYKFAEHLFVGVANGYYIALYWHNSLKPNLFEQLAAGNFLYIIPLLLGLMYFARFIPKVSWLVRIPIGFMIGWGAGISIPAYFQAFVLKQLEGTIVIPQNFTSPLSGVWAVISLIGVVCTLIYFYFSKEHKGLLKPTARLGIFFIMIGFGASFGYTVMARVSLLIGRIQFLLGPWLGLIK
ncbi:MAG TPA: hypothetical protein ENI34_09535 [candidate division WOR-3 bacterium]|uniref:Uncharacterized protein n=1 Tax=candidate division WOR-3 bacterium TaxID=2052148 RepID=A0A9C9K175_UNCW3|nr:hypothetical protein [candidate division WOR-3 bacterium]